jgi:multicomponent Na+:H+ antiporter subunit E
MAVSLVPGSLIIDADSSTRTLTIHVLDAAQQSDADFAAQVLAQEDRIRRALGDDAVTPAPARRSDRGAR